MSELHVVLGTGPIGRAVAEELVGRGKRFACLIDLGKW